MKKIILVAKFVLCCWMLAAMSGTVFAQAILAPGRPRGSPHADLDDSGRRAVEDGRLRHHSHLLSHLSRRRLRAGLVRLRPGHRQHGLRRLAALAQKDFKRLVAYSSVSHMGYVLLGIGAWSATAGMQYKSDYWTMGMSGAMFQMIAHGLSSAGMFFLVGVIYDRVHHRDLDQFGGLFARMPLFAGLSMGIFFAALGLPGLCGFIGEFFVVLGAWSYSKALAIVAASVVILTAGYILWTIQRVYLGSEYKGPHGDELRPMSGREVAIAAPLLAFAILFGVYPLALFNYITPSVQKTVAEMAAWTAETPQRPGPCRGAEAAVNFDQLVQSVVQDTVAPGLRLWRSGRS